MAVRVVTDSAADLTDELAAELGVRVVPLTIRFGSEEFVDRQDLTPAEFYARCAASSVLPETAAPSPGAFEAAFSAAFDEGADAVVCINLSSGLSAKWSAKQPSTSLPASPIHTRSTVSTIPATGRAK